MRNRVFILLFLLSAYAGASRFILVEGAFSEKIQGLQLYYYNISSEPGLNLSLGLGFMYLMVDESPKFEDGSIFALSPGVTLRYLTPYWLMPEANASLNVGYESYDAYTHCSTDLEGSYCATKAHNQAFLGVTFSQKLILVPPFKISPLLGVGIFETYNFRSEIYPKDFGLTLSVGMKF